MRQRFLKASASAGRRIAQHASYANVTATIALFVSLGGASYAAIQLPADSVGARQLRPGAVNTNALAFPLQSTSFTDQRGQDLTKDACNSPPRAGELPPSCSPVILEGTSPAHEAHLRLRSAGKVLASAVVSLENQGEPGTTATVDIALLGDGRALSRRGVTMTGGTSLQVPLQALASAPSGLYSVGVGATAGSYSSNGPGDVIVSPVSIIATALPG